MKDEIYQVKIGLFMALNKCKEKVYLLVPNSKKEKFLMMFDSLSNVQYDYLENE